MFEKLKIYAPKIVDIFMKSEKRFIRLSREFSEEIRAIICEEFEKHNEKVEVHNEPERLDVYKHEYDTFTKRENRKSYFRNKSES